jgi:hypothetical protein
MTRSAAPSAGRSGRAESGAKNRRKQAMYRPSIPADTPPLVTRLDAGPNLEMMLRGMSKKTPWIFVDCEARGTSPVHGVLTEFGAVHYDTRDTFHGRLFDATPDPGNPAISIVGERIATDIEVAERFAAWLRGQLGNQRPVFVSDNPAYDWQWIAGMFYRAGMDNPFGHSARRISDFWAGLNQDWSETQSWKRFRRTPHDHNPVNDAMGNAEAFDEILRIARSSALRQE